MYKKYVKIFPREINQVKTQIEEGLRSERAAT